MRPCLCQQLLLCLLVQLECSWGAATQSPTPCRARGSGQAEWSQPAGAQQAGRPPRRSLAARACPPLGPGSCLLEQQRCGLPLCLLLAGLAVNQASLLLQELGLDPAASFHALLSSQQNDGTTKFPSRQ